MDESNDKIFTGNMFGYSFTVLHGCPTHGNYPQTNNKVQGAVMFVITIDHSTKKVLYGMGALTRN